MADNEFPPWLGAIAKALGGMPGFSIPGGIAPGLEAAVDFQPGRLTYTNGAHVAEVEVDPETGGVKITRYVVVHDCGNMINPIMVEGQILGGIVHGIGATLLEWMRYDEQGQPMTVTYADYLLPTADVVPRIEIHHMVSPTPLNPLGVKGAAESGTIGAPAAIVSAIEDALRPLQIRIRDLPLTPARLRGLIRQAAGGSRLTQAILRSASGPFQSSLASRLALPPTAAVLIVTTCSLTKRRR